MTLDRRKFIGGFGAALGAFYTTRLSAAIDPGVRKVLDQIAEIAFRHSPETLAKLGLDTGENRWARPRLNDRSRAERDRTLAEIPVCLRLLNSLQQSKMSAHDRHLCAAVEHALENGDAGKRFTFGSIGAYGTIGIFGGGVPYIVSQQDGVYQSVPTLLQSLHPVASRDDAAAYLARLAQFAVSLDQENARITHDAAQGVVPPSFLLDTVLVQLRTLRSSSGLQSQLILPLVEKAAAKGISGDWQRQGQTVAESQVAPAIDRQIAVIQSLRVRATADAGVWKLPQGSDYYAWLLAYGTSTSLSPDAIHQMGLEQGRAIDAHLETALKKQGLTRGTVGERLAALTVNPTQVFPNTESGRSELISYANTKVGQLRRLLPRVSRMTMKAELVVRRVPKEIEAGASLGYADFAALDGSRPATYFINVRDTANWPRFTVPSLSAHEGLPGHAWQGAYAAEHRADVPLISSLVDYNAWGEGWAVYCEQLVDELGFYDDDPFGRIGMYQALRFRASRLVVDTGLHAKRWSREKAVDYMVSTTGRARVACISEVDRYCAAPGTACGYKIGHTEMLRLRDHAKHALGLRFDVRDFNDIVVQTGSVPFDVLGMAIDEWIASSRSGTASQRT